MKSIKNHPSLSMDSLTGAVRSWRHARLIVGPALFRIANEISAALMKGFIEDNPKLREKFTEIEIYERYRVRVIAEEGMDDHEWMIADGRALHYSEGTNRAN